MMLEYQEYLTHRKWMNHALKLAQLAGDAGEVPVGAVIVNTDDQLIAAGENRKERDQDPTAHAEIVAIRAASQILQTWRLHQCTLYVTLEPCPMCAGAIVHGRLGKLIYGVDDTKTGAIRTVINIPDHPASNHRIKVVGGILESECREQLQSWFFSQRRQQK
ncbi:tRNA adenosine(34) deaminase TadA [Cuspidothrix issatschenkoi LEGE 03284]|nr:tRNA adenosine(34) deaminase TadA [Cuspidothrix issatschenkoi]MBE9232628.1 tRNA adenosine(34) deaminase TadA [Cuspidothrix issatschenkoi LEGE 03284]